MSNKYYVEVVASDGLAHHIGPFARRSTADAWIKQHSGEWNAVPPANLGIAENLTAIHQIRTVELLL
jgi:hypothetical protein